MSYLWDYQKKHNMRKRRDDVEVAIVNILLSESKETVFNTVCDDEVLSMAIDSLLDDLYSKNIEVFFRDRNIVITENGYYVAVYPKDLIKVE